MCADAVPVVVNFSESFPCHACGAPIEQGASYHLHVAGPHSSPGRWHHREPRCAPGGDIVTFSRGTS